jgi:subtilisin-like proprotein convertase family protein
MMAMTIFIDLISPSRLARTLSLQTQPNSQRAQAQILEQQAPPRMVVIKPRANSETSA